MADSASKARKNRPMDIWIIAALFVALFVALLFSDAFAKRH